LNFTHPALARPNGDTLEGRYLSVRVTRAGPNSLAGESVDGAAASFPAGI
jgi:tRNA-2-methylthio-N6-dimethylallyladenosine synthase